MVSASFLGWFFFFENHRSESRDSEAGSLKALMWFYYGLDIMQIPMEYGKPDPTPSHLMLLHTFFLILAYATSRYYYTVHNTLLLCSH